jgi:hypothetical protein
MGVYYYVYLGPYAVCKNPKKVEQVPHRGCLKQGCAKHKRDVTVDVSFCSGCGDAIGEWSTQRETTVVRFHDLFNGGDPLTQINIDGDPKEYVIPNERRNAPRVFGLGQRNVGVTPVREDMIPAEVEWFQKVFADEIAEMREAYGQENVTISWGALQYAW